jgi:outer membrane protein assembly factor BamA
MSRSNLLLPAICLLFSCTVMQAQTYQPKTIQFKGDTDYSNEELLSASGLKSGTALTVAEMNEHTKQLMDIGVFQDISFSFNGQDLTFQIIPAAVLVPPRFENLPLDTGKALDDRLRARFPLYRGKLPADGTLLDSVRKELDDELKAEGIDATLLVSPYTDLKTDKIIAISFTITIPEIRVGEVQIEGASPALAAEAARAVTHLAGSAYSNEGSISQIETALTNFYAERGYLEIAAHAAIKGSITADAQGAHVPFTATVTERTQFKLASIKLAPGLIVSQGDFDKQSGLHPGDIVSLTKLRAEWEFVGRQYHNKGMVRARILPTATLNLTDATAAYTVDAEPGPVYTMGTLTVENVTDDLRAAIIQAFPVHAGATFDEGAIASMTAIHDADSALERVFANNNLRYVLKLHDDTHIVDLVLSLERKH